MEYIFQKSLFPFLLNKIHILQLQSLWTTFAKFCHCWRQIFIGMLLLLREFTSEQESGNLLQFLCISWFTAVTVAAVHFDVVPLWQNNIWAVLHHRAGVLTKAGFFSGRLEGKPPKWLLTGVYCLFCIKLLNDKQRPRIARCAMHLVLVLIHI